MATKDWKKSRNKSNSQGWENQKSKENILFVRFMGDDYWSFMQEGKTEKTFKTKTEAMKFARGYMRSH